MDVSQTIETIANTTFRNGKIVFNSERDVLKLHYHLMTQVFLLRKGFVLTYPEKCTECELSPCSALICFCVLKEYGTTPIGELPPGVCGCPFKHSELWIQRTETKIANIIKSNRNLQEEIVAVVQRLEAMKLPAKNNGMYRTAYNLKAETFHSIPLPQFNRDEVFAATTAQRPQHATRPRTQTKNDDDDEEPPANPRADTRAAATHGSWSAALAVKSPVLDIDAALSAAAQSESNVEQLKKLLAEEEAKFAKISETKEALERKRKADDEAAALEAKIMEMRAAFKKQLGGAPAVPVKLVFPKSGHPVVIAKRTEAAKAVNDDEEAEEEEKEADA
jgi:hypothetical protein